MKKNLVGYKSPEFFLRVTNSTAVPSFLELKKFINLWCVKKSLKTLKEFWHDHDIGSQNLIGMKSRMKYPRKMWTFFSWGDWFCVVTYVLNFFNNVTLIREVFRSLPAWGVTKNTRNIIYGKLKTKFWFSHHFCNDETIKKGRLHYQNTIIVDHLLPNALGNYTIRVARKV